MVVEAYKKRITPVVRIEFEFVKRNRKKRGEKIMIMGICQKIKWNNLRTIRNGTTVEKRGQSNSKSNQQKKMEKTTETKDEAIKYSALFSNQKKYIWCMTFISFSFASLKLSLSLLPYT